MSAALSANRQMRWRFAERASGSRLFAAAIGVVGNELTWKVAHTERRLQKRHVLSSSSPNCLFQQNPGIYRRLGPAPLAREGD
jgi:hypothetical protein